LGPDGQPLPAIPAGPSAIDSGTIQATSKDDVSDGSKFKTYDNYEKAVLAKPSSSAIYSLCNLYFKDGLYERAVKLAKKDKGRDVKNLFIIAIGSRLSGNFDESINAYNEILAVSPDNAEANLGLGIAYKSKGDFSKAINHLQRYLNVRPDAEVSREIAVLSEAMNNK
jgi:tetratricopeptide (TPR) repeat protein